MGASAIIPCTKVMNLQKDHQRIWWYGLQKIHHLKHSKRLGKQNTNGTVFYNFASDSLIPK
jgi:hypothetical protein